MSWPRLGLVLALLLWSAGCGEPEGDAPTQVMLRIHNDDDALLGRMSDLRVSLFRRESSGWVPRGSHVHSMRVLHWPVDIPILPSSDAAAAKDFEVLIEALAGEQVLAETRVLSGFALGAWRLLEATLFTCPRAPELPACAPVGCHAEECALCTPGGDCAQVERVNPLLQPRFDPAASQPDAAAPADHAEAGSMTGPAREAGTGADAATSGDPETDGGAVDVVFSDAGPGLDASTTPDAGSPGDTGALPGDATSPLVDTAVQDPCDGVACVQGATCSNVSGAARCMCKSGFTGDGGVCTAQPSCASLNCSMDAECVGSGSSLRCQCLSGFDGNGTSCTDHNECATNNGGCGDAVYNSCTNRRGAAASCSLGGTFGAVQRGPAPTLAITGAQGPYTVMSYTSGFVDSPAYLAATISYPTPFETTPFAAIGAVTGFVSVQSSLANWSSWLASHGFIVINIDTNSTSEQPSARADAVYAALETLRLENTRSGGPLFGHVRTTHMGVLGWSMGGGGALEAASDHPDLKAVMALAPWYSPAMLPNVRVPALILGASAATDTTATDIPEQLYNSFPSTTPRLLFLSDAGGHSLAAAPASLSGEFGRYGVAWFRVFLDGDLRYRQFLNTPLAPTSRFSSGALP